MSMLDRTSARSSQCLTLISLSYSSWAMAQPDCAPQWLPVGTVSAGQTNQVLAAALTVMGEGENATLYAGGNFTRYGTEVVRRVARWNSVTQGWEPLGNGLGLPNQDTNGGMYVETLYAYDDGTTVGQALYAGGAFDSAGGRAVPGLARWGCLKGDLNCDGRIDNFDIDPFVLVLTSPADYDAAYPACRRIRGDINSDGAINAFDVDPFIDCLSHGVCR